MGEILAFNGAGKVNMGLKGSAYMYAKDGACLSHFYGGAFLQWVLGQPVFRHLEVKFDFEDVLVGFRPTSGKITMEDGSQPRLRIGYLAMVIALSASFLSNFI